MTTVARIPARTDTKWFHEYLRRSTDVRFIKGRLTFSSPTCDTGFAAPFPSGVAVIGPSKQMSSAWGPWHPKAIHAYQLKVAAEIAPVIAEEISQLFLPLTLITAADAQLAESRTSISKHWPATSGRTV